ncbi:MAG: glycerol dehydrogenase [Lachnospiraceae bacterium]|nr:glycerol dehydrogenase [Lachnospiraceae bacterium]
MANNLKTTTMSWGSPGRYIQGPGELENLPKYTSMFGENVFAVIDQFFYDTLTEKLSRLYEGRPGVFKTVVFNTEVSEEQIAEKTAIARTIQPSVIVGIGGGKTLDTAKAVADDLHVPVIVSPTSASTDAPTSSLSVIYKPNGEHSHARHYIKNPDIVLIDSRIIADAPVRFLVSGMGDALATVFEAKANQASDSANYIAGEAGEFRRTKTAMVIAQACYDMLIANGLKAKLAAERHCVTEALETIIEVNTLMSGLGFENTGCAAAHSVQEGITAVPTAGRMLHGEQVAFGTICELVAENAPVELIDEVMNFCMSVGLPITLEDVKVEATEENVRIIAESSVKNSYWAAQPAPVTPESVMDIIFAADALGHYYYDQKNK